jgi:hypothetical protein
MMKYGNTLSLSIAAACLALLGPGYARAASPGATANIGTIAQQQEAAQMVSAQAHLLKTLDARKTRNGGQFEAVLDNSVHLKNGTELPHGTVLVGKVATDQMHPNGTSRLALRFTEAKLKDGKAVPIHVMIAGVGGPVEDGYYGNYTDAPPTWSKSVLQMDENGAINDVDFHSNISSADSGVFVSTKKDDVKLSAGSQLSLAIAASPNRKMMNTNGGV